MIRRLLTRYGWPYALVVLIWGARDFFIHQILLRDMYFDVLSLWRGDGELHWIVNWLYLMAFCGIFLAFYDVSLSRKTTVSSVGFGILFGLYMGTISAAGLYWVLNGPVTLVLGWFFAWVLQAGLAGFVLSKFFRESDNA